MAAILEHLHGTEHLWVHRLRMPCVKCSHKWFTDHKGKMRNMSKNIYYGKLLCIAVVVIYHWLACWGKTWYSFGLLAQELLLGLVSGWLKSYSWVWWVTGSRVTPRLLAVSGVTPRLGQRSSLLSGHPGLQATGGAPGGSGAHLGWHYKV